MSLYRKIFLFCAVIMSFACSRADDTIDRQQQAIVNYLKGLDADYVDLNHVYRYVYYNANVTPQKLVQNGDSAYIYFGAFEFHNRPSGLFNTNITSFADAAGLDKTYLKFEPLGVRIGAGDLIRGLDRGLVGCRAGDSTMLFMSSDMAYGVDGLYTVDPSTSVAFMVVIDRIVSAK